MARLSSWALAAQLLVILACSAFSAAVSVPKAPVVFFEIRPQQFYPELYDGQVSFQVGGTPDTMRPQTELNCEWLLPDNTTEDLHCGFQQLIDFSNFQDGSNTLKVTATNKDTNQMTVIEHNMWFGCFDSDMASNMGIYINQRYQVTCHQDSTLYWPIIQSTQHCNSDDSKWSVSGSCAPCENRLEGVDSVDSSGYAVCNEFYYKSDPTNLQCLASNGNALWGYSHGASPCTKCIVQSEAPANVTSDWQVVCPSGHYPEETSLTCDETTGFTTVGKCIDVNECKSSPRVCHSSKECTNTVGSYQCGCPVGSNWEQNQCIHCGNRTSVPGLSVNASGSFQCDNQHLQKVPFAGKSLACKNGSWQWPDFDMPCKPCATSSMVVPTPASKGISRHTDILPSGEIRCDGGYTPSVSYRATCLYPSVWSWNGLCKDIDECVTDTHNCSKLAACTNTIGSYTCTCKTGYVMKNGICDDVDECANGYHVCQPPAKCLNTMGGYICQCATGYRAVGFTCIDLDECHFHDDDCHANASCTNTKGSYECSCDTGYQGNGKICKDIDECADRTHACDTSVSECVNTISSYVCQCKTGYKKSPAGICEDIDECKTNTHTCSQKPNSICQNTIGSFSCPCKPSYTHLLVPGTCRRTHCPQITRTSGSPVGLVRTAANKSARFTCIAGKINLQNVYARCLPDGNWEQFPKNPCVVLTDCKNGGTLHNGGCICDAFHQGVQCQVEIPYQFSCFDSTVRMLPVVKNTRTWRASIQACKKYQTGPKNAHMTLISKEFSSCVNQQAHHLQFPSFTGAQPLATPTLSTDRGLIIMTHGPNTDETKDRYTTAFCMSERHLCLTKINEKDTYFTLVRYRSHTPLTHLESMNLCSSQKRMLYPSNFGYCGENLHPGTVSYFSDHGEEQYNLSNGTSLASGNVELAYYALCTAPLKI